MVDSYRWIRDLWNWKESEGKEVYSIPIFLCGKIVIESFLALVSPSLALERLLYCSSDVRIKLD